MVMAPFRSRIGRRGLLTTPTVLGIEFVCGSRQPTAARQGSALPTLLVRGEATLSGAPMAWRVVSDVAEAGAAAAFERRALGFAVATNPFTAFLLTDEATGSAYRLAPGDAAFVRDGTMQRRESLADAADSYLRIGLVEPAAATDPGGDRLRFAGPTFHRIELGSGESFAMSPDVRDTETLVLVEQGEVNVETSGSSPRDRRQSVVGSDTAYAFRSVSGEATLYGQVEGTRVLVATVE